MSSGNFQSGQGSSSTGFGNLLFFFDLIVSKRVGFAHLPESCVSRWHSWFATYPSEIEHVCHLEKSFAYNNFSKILPCMIAFF
jgi:hypothetical protein